MELVVLAYVVARIRVDVVIHLVRPLLGYSSHHAKCRI